MTERVLIVVAPYYEAISDKLLEGATAVLNERGCEVHVREVPGALELPVAIRIAMETDAFDGFVALGCVIRGETSHYDVVAGESCRALTDLACGWGTAIGNGILTVENGEQAEVRADPAQKDKGGDAARACVALMELRAEMGPGGGDEDDDPEGEREPTFRPDDEHVLMAGSDGTARRA